MRSTEQLGKAAAILAALLGLVTSAAGAAQEHALSLEEAIARGLERNEGILIERESLAVARAAASGAEGAYDPRLEVEGGALRLLRMPARIGQATEPFGSYAVPVFARYYPEGIYETATFDAGEIERQRLEVDLVGEAAVAPLPFGRLRLGVGRRRRADGSRIPLGAKCFANSHRYDLRPVLPLPVQVEIDTSPACNGPTTASLHGPQPAGSSTAPACRKVSSSPSEDIRFSVRSEPGAKNRRT